MTKASIISFVVITPGPGCDCCVQMRSPCSQLGAGLAAVTWLPAAGGQREQYKCKMCVFVKIYDDFLLPSIHDKTVQ